MGGGEKIYDLNQLLPAF